MADKETRYFVLIASEQLADKNKNIAASSIFQQLIEKSSWYLAPYTPFRKLYREGDKVLFYLGGYGHRYFAGTAVIANKPQPITSSDAGMLGKLGLWGYNSQLPLRDIIVWRQGKPIKPLVPLLSFIKDKKNYGLHLRQGATQISEEDYRRIMDA